MLVSYRDCFTAAPVAVIAKKQAADGTRNEGDGEYRERHQESGGRSGAGKEMFGDFRC